MRKDKENCAVERIGVLSADAAKFAAASDLTYDTRFALELNGVGEELVPELRAKLAALIGEDAAIECDGRETTVGGMTACDRLRVPPLSFLQKSRHDFADLLAIMKRLCAKDGCEWDKAQTHESIRANAIEEAYELVDAIDNKDVDNMREECGDVMLQSVFHCQIADKSGEFDVGDVLSELCNKLIERHPHVFGDVVATNADESLAAWDAAKAKEKGAYSASAKMKRIAKALPAVERAYKAQKAAAKARFDFASAQDAAAKVPEELQECFGAVTAEDREMECGDLLFAAVNVVRLLKCDPEVALSRAVNKFVGRFERMEKLADRPLAEMTAAQLDELWNEAKK